MTKSIALAAILVVAVTFQAVAATGWERLSELHPGDRVTVTEISGKVQRGEFVAVSPNDLSIRTGGAGQTIARPEIVRVQSSAKSNSVRNAAIGAAAGLGGSIVTDRTLGVRLNNEGAYGSAAKVLIWTLPIVAGAAIGALTGRNPTIYKAPRK